MTNERELRPTCGRITALRFQKQRRDWVNLYLDEQFALALPALEAARLKVGQILTADEVSALHQTGEQQALYDKAVAFLAYRPRSISEVRGFLREKKADERASAAIIEKLEAAGYVDDRAFARWWVENRRQFNPRGAYALRQELRLKGIAPAIIEEALAGAAQDGETGLVDLAARRARRLAGEEERAFKRKLSDFLLRRGYAYDEIAPLVEHLWTEIEQERDLQREGESS